MSLKDKKFLSLREIEGAISHHQGFVAGEMERRKEALEHLDDVFKLAEHIGGSVESVGVGENWAIRKEFFPGVEVFFIYDRASDEFPSKLRVLYSGDRVRKVRGEDLVELTIAGANHMLRYVRETSSAELPEICYRV